MKNPLHYQLTEYDCGPTSLLNAVNYLFEREEIPPEIVRNIMLYCLDCYGADGVSGKSGTSGINSYEVKPGKAVSFSRADFNKLFQKKYSGDVFRVVFDRPGSDSFDEGTLSCGSNQFSYR